LLLRFPSFLDLCLMWFGFSCFTSFAPSSLRSSVDSKIQIPPFLPVA
jgi:hypothetical protein